MAKERQLPEILEIPFIICDNTLNRKGWRLLVEGIDHTGFDKNPVCCVQHDTWKMPVGKWKNLKVENSNFTGTVEFDRNDEDAVKLYWKYKDGYMNAVSLNVIPIEESEDPSLLEKEQRYPTLTKSELLEISLVTVPGQKNAIKLSTPDGADYKLNIITNQTPKNMDPKEKENKDKHDELQQQLDAAKKTNAKNLVKLHQQRGVVQDAEVEHLTKLAESDYDTVEKMLDARKKEEKEPGADGKNDNAAAAGTEEAKKLAETIKSFTQNADGAKPANDRASWTYYDWFRKDPTGLSLMAEKEPEKYKKLEADFNEEAKSMNLKAD